MSLKRIALRDFVIVRELDAGPGRRLHRADRRNRRRQIHPDRRAAAGPGRARRCRRGARRRRSAARSAPSSTRPPRWPAGSTKPASPATTTCCCAAPSTPRARAAPGSTAARPPPRSCASSADQLVDIHGQHAWQSLTRPDAVRGLLDAYAGCRTQAAAAAVAALAQRAQGAGRRARRAGHPAARARTPGLADRRARQAGARRGRVGRTQHPAQPAVQCAVAAATRRRPRVDALQEADDNAAALLGRALTALQKQEHIEPEFKGLTEVLGVAAWRRSRTPCIRCTVTPRQTELEPQRLAELDERLSLWMSAGAALQAHAGRTAGAAGVLAGRAATARCGGRPGRAGKGRAGRPKPPTWPKPARCPKPAPRPRRSWPRPSRRRCRAWACRAASSRWRWPSSSSRRSTGWKQVEFLVAGHSRQHAAAGRQGGLRRRAVAHRAGDRRHHQPAGPGADPDL